jgi:nicotinate-nucleotide adenylyltransferase
MLETGLIQMHLVIPFVVILPVEVYQSASRAGELAGQMDYELRTRKRHAVVCGIVRRGLRSNSDHQKTGETMRIGVFGGTFDPVHVGHLVLAEQCREQCRLDEVWFVPARLPPHKAEAEISSPKQRLEMLELAIGGHDCFRVQRVELNRPGPSFTVDTLRQFHDESPRHEWFLLLGADSVHDLPTWREPERILELATIIAVNRGDQAAVDLSGTANRLGLASAERILSVQMPGLDISASDLRARVRAGRSIRYLVPRAVEVSIREQGLYRGEPHAT